MTTQPIHTTALAARQELQQLVESCRLAHHQLDDAELDNAEVRARIADILTAIACAEILGQLRPSCAAWWRLAACDPGTATPPEQATALLARHAPYGLGQLSIHSLHQIRRQCAIDNGPGDVIAVERLTVEIDRRLTPVAYHHA